jgi:hypothetical protein
MKTQKYERRGLLQIKIHSLFCFMETIHKPLHLLLDK